SYPYTPRGRSPWGGRTGRAREQSPVDLSERTGAVWTLVRRRRVGFGGTLHFKESGDACVRHTESARRGRDGGESGGGGDGGGRVGSAGVRSRLGCPRDGGPGAGRWRAAGAGRGRAGYRGRSRGRAHARGARAGGGDVWRPRSAREQRVGAGRAVAR